MQSSGTADLAAPRAGLVAIGSAALPALLVHLAAINEIPHGRP